MAGLLIACVAAALVTAGLASSDPRSQFNWRDPEEPRALHISGIPTQPVAIGSRLEMVCSSEGLMETTTITWARADGAFVESITRGRSNLTLSLTVTAAHNGAEFYCYAPFTEFIPQTVPYVLHSERVRLVVQGAPDQHFPTHEHYIQMLSNVTSTTHHVGDVVNYNCRTSNAPRVNVAVYFVKNQYQTRATVGVQPTTIRAEDDGIHIYCEIFFLAPGTVKLLNVVSNSIQINVAT